MTKFVDTLVRLPNLRTLELLGVSHRSPVTRGLKRKCAQFPSIREMTVCCVYPDFIKSCPNLESLVFKGPFMGSYKDIGPYCARLKRVGGVDIAPGSNVECELLNVPSDRKKSFNVPVLQPYCCVARSCRRSHSVV